MKYSPLLIATVAFLAFPAHPVLASEPSKQDDTVAFNLSTESWVTTKTAKVVIGVESAVSSENSGTMRNNMGKAVADSIKGEWRLVNFNRSQDTTGMERWSAQYEARINEADLAGIHDKLKKISKAGMQLSVADIQFTPTLEETQAVQTQLRTTLYKMANEQLTILNTSIPNRNFRISEITFIDGTSAPPMPPRYLRMAKQAMMSADESMAGSSPESMEKAQKVILSAHVELAASPQPPK